jgi:Mg/Co/Ni transporter MgtE
LFAPLRYVRRSANPSFLPFRGFCHDHGTGLRQRGRTRRDLLHSDDVESAREVLLAMHSADQADLFDSLDYEERQTMLSLLDADGVAALLEHMDEDARKEVAEKMPRGQAF